MFIMPWGGLSCGGGGRERSRHARDTGKGRGTKRVIKRLTN